MAIRRFTTPTVEIIVGDKDITGSKAYATFRQERPTGGMRRMTIPASSMDYDGIDTTVYVQMTQEQTGSLYVGHVEIDLNWITSNGKRNGTAKTYADVEDNLLDSRIDYDAGN